MEDYIYYIIYGLFGIFALIALIVKIKNLIYRSKYTSFRFINLLEYIPDILSLAYFVLYFTSLFYVFKMDSLLETIICSIVLIPVGFYLIFIKPQKEEKISELEKEVEEKDKKIKEYESIRETICNLEKENRSLKSKLEIEKSMNSHMKSIISNLTQEGEEDEQQ